jgi:hypothetical protein
MSSRNRFLQLEAYRKVEWQVKVLIKNVAIMSQEAVSAVSLQIQLLEYFPLKQKEQRHKQLGYTDKLVTTQINKLKNSRSTLKSSNSYSDNLQTPQRLNPK